MSGRNTGVDVELERELYEAVAAEYRGTQEYEDDLELVSDNQIDEFNLRLRGYRKEDLEPLFGPKTERTRIGRPVWSLEHVRQVEAERLGPFVSVIRQSLAICLDMETVREHLETVLLAEVERRSGRTGSAGEG